MNTLILHNVKKKKGRMNFRYLDYNLFFEPLEEEIEHYEVSLDECQEYVDDIKEGRVFLREKGVTVQALVFRENRRKKKEYVKAEALEKYHQYYLEGNLI